MTLTATVADIHQVTPDVKQFRLIADDHTFDYRPGQHTTIHFKNEGEGVESLHGREPSGDESDHHGDQALR